MTREKLKKLYWIRINFGPELFNVREVL